MERTDLEQWKAREVARLLALVETERRYYQEMVAMLPVALVVISADVPDKRGFDLVDDLRDLPGRGRLRCARVTGQGAVRSLGRHVRD